MFDAVFDFFVPPTVSQRLAEAVSVGNLKGLEASGWYPRRGPGRRPTLPHCGTLRGPLALLRARIVG